MSGRSKGSRKILLKAVVLVLVLVILFSLYKIGTIAYGYYKGRDAYNRIAEEAGARGDAEAEKDELEIKFGKLKEKYPDVRAWIYSKGTIINYPVAQGEDNDWYLHRTLDGEWNGAGTLFIDENNVRPFEEFLTIIYGHHMQDGSMFASLVKYRDREYYEKHKKLKLYTPDKKYDLIVIGASTVPAYSKAYKYDFDGDKVKKRYIKQIEENSEVECDDHADAGDRLVMLSTCTYEFDDARFIVFAKLVEDE